jgi:Helix-turn-helix domain
MSVDQISGVMDLLVNMNEELRQLRTEVVALRKHPTAPPPPRTYYSVEEVADLLDRSSYTVREWCRNGQVNAVKKAERRGAGMLWNISAGEVARYKNEGLLPINPDRNNRN